VTDDLVDTLRVIVELLDEHRIQYMLVGSVAALAHGRSRATQDFDIVIEVDVPRTRALVAALPPERFYVSEDAALDAIRCESLFNVIDLETGWKVDLVPRKRREFSRTEFERRTEVELLGLRIFVATLEDTVIAKLEWSKLGGGSARQLEDVRDLVLLAGQRLDVAYVERWIEELGLEAEWRAVK
jgi:hypothetical protein